MLKVDKQDSYPFLLANKSKLRFLGTLPSEIYEFPVVFKEDGTVKEVHTKDRASVNNFNELILKLKPRLIPVIEFISHEIFKDERIMSQELVIHKEDNILALCDLSTENAVLEIKTNYRANPFAYRNQLFYEANGRQCFLLQIDWSKLPDIFVIEILEAHMMVGERPQKGRRILMAEQVQEKLDNDNIEVIQYAGQNLR